MQTSTKKSAAHFITEYTKVEIDKQIVEEVRSKIISKKKRKRKQYLKFIEAME
jgi:hypothetical protein